MNRLSVEKQALSVTYTKVEAAAKRLKNISHLTPVLTSTTVNQLTNAKVFLKCENFQRTGSFKFRGAYNTLSQLSDVQKQQGVITYSSGNHGQAIALSGKLLGIPTTIDFP
ncbi:MAG: pyridoxal-phosphate dependent enzyme [Xenococcaceae cyanobacterium MO_167.B27]|nr:pyridoxal-phosphate dependent enzyme [Xenococcaceae cyanobacterium MO_167.B27]